MRPHFFRKLAIACVETLLFPIGYINGFFSRNRNLWAFGSWRGERFADNPKHLFLYLLDRTDAPRCIWISGSRLIVRTMRSAGLPAVYQYSIRGLYLSARANVFVFDSHSADVSRRFSRGAFLVNTWHGIPLKKIEADIDHRASAFTRMTGGTWWSRTFWQFFRPEVSEQCDLIVSTSPEVSVRMASAFRVPTTRIAETGLPRNDCLLSARASHDPCTDEDSAVRRRIDSIRSAGGRVILYMPTFRDAGGASAPLDWGILNDVLEETNCALLCKLHPLDSSGLNLPRGLSRIHRLSPSLDVYPLLKDVDALATDYSSVFFDFLILNRPILFLAHDLQEYLLTCRGLYSTYEDSTPGPRAYSIDECMGLVRAYCEERLPDYSDARAIALQLLHTHVDGSASERLHNEVSRRLRAAGR